MEDKRYQLLDGKLNSCIQSPGDHCFDDLPLLLLWCLNGEKPPSVMPSCTAKSELQELKKQIYRLHKEYLDNGDGHNGFIHDLSVLVSDGLEDGYSARQMAKKIADYVEDLKQVNSETI